MWYSWPQPVGIGIFFTLKLRASAPCQALGSCLLCLMGSLPLPLSHFQINVGQSPCTACRSRMQPSRDVHSQPLRLDEWKSWVEVCSVTVISEEAIPISDHTVAFDTEWPRKISPQVFVIIALSTYQFSEFFHRQQSAVKWYLKIRPYRKHVTGVPCKILLPLSTNVLHVRSVVMQIFTAAECQ